MSKVVANKPENEKKQSTSAWGGLLAKFNKLAQTYANYLPTDGIFSAFMRAGYGTANFAPIQNSRVKAISSLPADYTKEEIGDMLRIPYESEKPLRQTSEVLRWTAYPYFKVTKTYQDISTYRYYFKPKYIARETAEKEDFKREAVLLDKLNKVLKPEVIAHKITGQAINEGKIFYHLRVDVDKAHNKVNYAFIQQLPSDWCQIIGFNNISGYTVSFNLMYFMQIGTDYRQFGDLFEPYMNDFLGIFEETPSRVPNKKFVYASDDGKQFYPNISKVNKNAYGNPKAFMQDGICMYYVSLPIDKVWTFEIDDTTTAVAPSLSGLMLTYSQQSDYEAAQLSLLLNPLIKIFTGEIPYRDDVGASPDDPYKLSPGGRIYFETLFAQLMAANNTGGTALYSAPFENIKSHDFAESANANEISESFNRYGMEKAGLAGLIPVTDDVKASQVDASMKIESRFTTATIYPQFERMMESLYDQLNLKYEWSFKMFGTIFTEKDIREHAQKSLDIGDISALFTLSALDGQSWVDKSAMLYAIKGLKLLDEYQVPQTAYTQSKSTQQTTQKETAGRPKSEDISDSKEKSVDAGLSSND
nr:MAG TPA: portal protein [Caudoviricetes sp.]